ncbi:MAG: hypothetical protein VB075_04495 [Petrimonas sp.]|jgi:hypothetical protein|uniref:hypothetical protein n=1 Tax=Petrimonas sp. TaxID=2023866 RepID=UPI002B3B1901|nr:hypothetical protein [Petrimonas sp.]
MSIINLENYEMGMSDLRTVSFSEMYTQRPTGIYDSSSTSSIESTSTFNRSTRKKSIFSLMLFLLGTTSIPFTLANVEHHSSLSHEIHYTVSSFTDYGKLDIFKSFISQFLAESVELEPEFSNLIKENISSLLW